MESREYFEEITSSWIRKEPKYEITDIQGMAARFSEVIQEIRTEEDAFEVVRELGRLNASAPKRNPRLPEGSAPEKNLPREELDYRNAVYEIKRIVLPILVEMYCLRKWDVACSESESGTVIYFRSPEGIQNTFHGYDGDTSRIMNRNEKWDGVAFAYRYGKNENPPYSAEDYLRILSGEQ